MVHKGHGCSAELSPDWRHGDAEGTEATGAAAAVVARGADVMV